MKRKKANIEFEEHWKVSSGAATIIPMNSAWKAIAIQVSGGLDSTILLYLTVKTIQKYNLDIKIFPVSLEIYNKAKNLGSSRAVIAKVQELTGFTNWGEIVEVIGDETNWRDQGKADFFSQVLRDLFKRELIDFEFKGVTKNPPLEESKDFKYNEFRQFDRDNPTTIYNSRHNASPHAFMNKKDIVELYIKHGVLDELAALTLSCDENLDIIIRNGWDVPCGTCWWCCERRWGLESNGLVYEDYSPLNAYPK
jgi:hypothetical protein